MKKFSNFLNEDLTPGNSDLNTGVTNHFTPIENILTNIKNLFCVRLSIAAEKGEDNVSIKLSSSKFVSEKTIDDLLYTALYNDHNTSTLYSYITSQGLTKVTKVNLGGYWVVYFSPTDIKSAEDPCAMTGGCCDKCCPCPCEATESVLNEFELSSIIKEDDEEELKSQTVEKVLELLDGPDKVKAAKQLELLISNEIQLPRDFYFSAIKFKNGQEAIALRWKYTKKMPFGKEEGDEDYKEITIENTRSIMHIFGKGDKAIWIQDWDKESLVKLPDEVTKLIESILDILEAGKTEDPSVYKLTGERREREEKKEDKDNDKDEKKDKNEDEDLLGDSDEDKDKEKKDKDSQDEDEDDLL